MTKQPKFVLNQAVLFEEGRQCEFKYSTDTLKYIGEHVDRYVVAYLNSNITGIIYWGIRDDGTVVGVRLNTQQRDEVRQTVDRQLSNCKPSVLPSSYNTHFRSVFDQNSNLIRDLYIVEVNVSVEPVQCQLHYTGSGIVYLKTDSGTMKLVGQDLTDEIIRREGIIRRAQRDSGDEDQPPRKEEPEDQSSNSEPPVDLEDFGNPYNIASTAKSDMFKGRDVEIRQLQNAIRDGRHTAIFGLQRMGKTSLVEKTLGDKSASNNLKDEILFVKVDLHRAGRANTTYKALLDTILLSIAEEISEIDIETMAKSLNTVSNQFKKKDDTTFMLSSYENILSNIVSIANKKVVLFLDEFSELCQTIEEHQNQQSSDEMLLDINLMHWFSALMKEPGGLVFIFAGRPFVAEYDTKHSLQLLKLMNPITLYHLDKTAAEALMTEPLEGKIEYGEGCINYLYNLTAGHPYLIQLFLQQIIDRIRDKKSVIEKQDIIDFEKEVISEDPAYVAHFNVLDSDYNIASVTNTDDPQTDKGVLALIADMGDKQEGRWVQGKKLRKVLTEHQDGRLRNLHPIKAIPLR